MAYLDLMAFARGAELANQENWRDVTNDINTRTAEEALRQSQIKFDTDLPGVQFGKETALDQGMGARRGVEFQVGVLSEMNKLPPEQQAEFLANSFRSRLNNIAATPGGAQELNALRDMVTMQANKFLTAGDTRSAQALFAAIPGAGQAQADQRGEVEKWSNPQTAFDEVNLISGAAQVGGRYDPQTKTVDLAGVKYDAPSFAQYMRELALNRFADRTPGMLARQNNQALSAYGDQLVEMYRRDGILATKNPITGVVSPLFDLKNNTPIQQAQPQTNANMSYAPGMAPLVLSNQTLGVQGPPVAQLPGATGPTMAATGYPETAGMRYPAAPQVTPLWQEWLNQAIQQQQLVEAQRKAVIAPYLPQLPPGPPAPGYTPGVAPAFNNWITGPR